MSLSDFLKKQPYKLYGVDRSDLDLLRFFLSDYSIYSREELPAFLPDNKNYVVLTNSNPVLNRSNILNLALAGNKKLFERETFFNIISELYDIPKKYLDNFTQCDIQEFWIYCKLLTVGLKPRDIFESTQNKKTSIFDLFCNLYSDFSLMYKIYLDMDLHYKIVFSALMSFLLRAKDLDLNKNLTKSDFIKVLNANKKYIPEIQKSVDIYIRSKQTESDFLAFLAGISNERFLVKD